MSEQETQGADEAIDFNDELKIAAKNWLRCVSRCGVSQRFPPRPYL